jgi:lipooligosaccharide transport system permease protein
VQWLVQATPLYQGVVLCRGVVTGSFTSDMAIAVVYLVVMGVLGLVVASRRFGRLLLR